MVIPNGKTTQNNILELPPKYFFDEKNGSVKNSFDYYYICKLLGINSKKFELYLLHRFHPLPDRTSFKILTRQKLMSIVADCSPFQPSTCLPPNGHQQLPILQTM